MIPKDAAAAMDAKCAAERDPRQSHHLPPGRCDKVGVFVHTAAVILWGKVALSAYSKQSRSVDQDPKPSDDLSWSSHVLPTDSSRRSPSHPRRRMSGGHIPDTVIAVRYVSDASSYSTIELDFVKLKYESSTIRLFVRDQLSELNN